jgi:hypothetical protein
LCNYHGSYSGISRRERRGIFEDLGILVSDIADCINSKCKSQFMNQKRDARQVLKHFTRRFNNLTFKNK